MKAAPAAANSDIPIGSRPQAQNPQTYDTLTIFYINLEALPTNQHYVFHFSLILGLKFHVLQEFAWAKDN